jgi:hypothetical protein
VERLVAASLFAAALCVVAVASGSSRPPLGARKQATLDHQFAVPADAAPPAPKNPAYLPRYVPPRPQVTLERVTANDVQAPVHPTLFVPTTQWVDVVDGVQVAIYGGSAPHDSGAAAIYVWISDLNTGLDLAGTGMFVAEGKRGPLTLTNISDGVATFTCPDGTGVFDLVSHEFRSAEP